MNERSGVGLRWEHALVNQLAADGRGEDCVGLMIISAKLPNYADVASHRTLAS